MGGAFFTGGRESLKRFGLALAMAALCAARASAQFCAPFCISNQSSPQNGAQFHISSATIDGRLTVGEIRVTTMTVSTMTASVFIGSGTYLTNLDAGQLLLGTLPSGRVSGFYTGLTGVGTLSAGTWQATAIAPQYGGTGQNFSTANKGSIPYFKTTGTMDVVPPPASFTAVLQSTGAAAPVWVSSPAIQGYNFVDVPLSALLSGTLAENIHISSKSISVVDGASILGDIAGNAAGISGTLALNKLGSGTLPTSIVASSITAPSPGVLKGVYGDFSHIPQLSIGTDGRISTVTLVGISIPLSDLQNGTLGSGILVPAANVQAGTLGGQVVASSVAASGVVAGTYGGPALIPQVTIGGDGRVTSATQISIQGIVAGTGDIGQDAIWQSTWQLTSGLLLEKIGNVYISTGTALYAYGSGGYIVGKSSITTSGGFFGDGFGITDLNPQNVATGSLPPTVIASSVAVNAVGDPQLTVTGVTAGSKGTATRVPTVVVNSEGRVTSLTDQTIAISTGEFIGVVQTNHGGTGNDWSATPAGGVPYFSGTGAMSVLAKSVDGYSLIQSAGLPAWADHVSSATNVVGGAAGSLPYQSAANTTALLAAGTNGYALQMAGGLPAWVAAVSSASNVAGGAANSIPYQSAANTTAFLAQGTGVLQESAGSPGWTTAPTITGGNLTHVVAANIDAGTLGPSVIASSVAATAVTAGSYGGASQSLSATVGVDGRLSALSAQSISIAASQVTSGQLAIARGGTNLSSAGGTANRVLRTSDGSTFAMGQIIGPDIAASTVALSSLNQSGASDGQTISWNAANSQWQPANAGVSGGVQGVVPVFNGANTLGGPGQGFITSVSTGVAISTNVSLGAGTNGGANGSSVTINATYLNVPMGVTPTGIGVRVANSSGTSSNAMTVVFQTGTKYQWTFDVTLTSGTSTTGSPIFTCKVNSDATAADYWSAAGGGYPNNYGVNLAGNTANLGWWGCGGGAIDPNDFGHWTENILNPITFTTTRLSMAGQGNYTCQNQGLIQNQQGDAHLYKGAGPWTLTCAVLNGFGASWESKVYQIGD